MPIKLVVCDMAGTTVFDNDNVNIAFREAMQDMGYKVTQEDVNEVMGYKKPEAIEVMLNTYEPDKSKITPDYVEEIHSLFVQKMIDFYKTDASVREIAGAAASFRKLKQAGIKVALDTGFSRDIAQTILDRLGWEKDGLIDASACSDEVEKGRPHPFMIQKIMRTTGVYSPMEIAKVGDTPVDLMEGQNAGCQLNIGVLSGAYQREELEKHPHTHIVEDITAATELILQHP